MEVTRTRTTPRDQSITLRRFARASDASGALRVAITSGKGGVGKTNVAVNLAVCLAAFGRRVTLVDLDTGLANADVLLDLHPRFNLSHVVSGERDMLGVVVDAPGGIRFIAGASGDRALANMRCAQRNRLIHQLSTVASVCDVVIYDCGAGITDAVLAFATEADVVMVVSTPEPTSVTDAYAMIKVLVREGFHGCVQLLVNMARGRGEAREVYRRVADVSERFLHVALADAGFVLHDVDVELAVRSRCPLVLRYPRCPSSICMTALAARMVRSGLVTPALRSGSLLARFVGLFA